MDKTYYPPGAMEGGKAFEMTLEEFHAKYMRDFLAQVWQEQSAPKSDAEMTNE